MDAFTADVAERQARFDAELAVELTRSDLLREQVATSGTMQHCAACYSVWESGLRSSVGRREQLRTTEEEAAAAEARLLTEHDGQLESSRQAWQAVQADLQQQVGRLHKRMPAHLFDRSPCHARFKWARDYPPTLIRSGRCGR